MDTKDRLEKLINMAENVQPLFLLAQQQMIERKAEMEQAERNLKDAKLSVTPYAEGKNAEQREAWIQGHTSVRAARGIYEDTVYAFNTAYADYAQHRASLTYVRDMTNLLRLYEDVE